MNQNSAIDQAAAALAEARVTADQTAAVLADATAVLDNLVARIGALETERTEIVTSRRAGANDPAHGARLALLAVDLEGLQEIAAGAERDVAAARAAHDEATSVVAGHEVQVARATDAEYLGRLIAHANDLDRLLFETIAEIGEASIRLGFQRPKWCPSEGLAQKVRHLDLNRGLVQ